MIKKETQKGTMKKVNVMKGNDNRKSLAQNCLKY